MKKRSKLSQSKRRKTSSRKYFQKGSVLPLIIVIVVAVIGIATLYVFKDNFNFKSFFPKSNIEQSCCIKCHNIANPENETSQDKTCLGSEGLSKECKDFFQKNSGREKECSNSQLQVITKITPISTDQGNTGGNSDNPFSKFAGQKCDQEYVWWRDMEEIEKRFRGKNWSGILSSDLHCSDGSGYNYSLNVKDLHIVFDSELDGWLKSTKGYKKAGIWTPCSDKAVYGGIGLKVKGSASVTYGTFTREMKKSSTTGMCDYTCTVTNDPIPINLTGKMLFTDEGLVVSTTAEKIGVDTQKLLESCGEDGSGCDPDKLLDTTEIKMEGYCAGNYCNDETFRCSMNKDEICGDQWHVSELMAEGDVNERGEREVEIINGKDLKFKTHIGTCSSGNADKESELTGTLILGN